MVTILARDTGTTDWYEKALMSGFGVFLTIPETIEEIDRKIGFFSWALSKNFSGSYLCFLDDGNCSKEVVSHACQMVATLPRTKIFSVGKTTSEDILFFSVSKFDAEKELLSKKIIEASHAHKITVCIEQTDLFLNEDVIDDVIRQVIGLQPDFIVTEHVQFAQKYLPAPQKHLWKRTKSNLSRKVQFLLKNTFARTLYFYENRKRQFITFEKRPMFAEDYTVTSNTYISFPPCAIVIQGPLQHDHEFTFETAKLYKKIFPSANIIVSTWIGEDEAVLERLRDISVVVVTSVPPQKRGVYNVNLQLLSAAKGVEEAQRSGAHYVLKHRSDQRIYSRVILEMMINLLIVFPPSKRSHQTKRIIFGNGGPSLRPYWMSEILFGAIEDIVEYYSAEPSGEKKDYYCILPELHLPSEFLKKKGWKLDWTVEQGMDVYRECFIPLDWTMLDLYWHKYWRYESNQQRRYSQNIPSDVLVTFGEWLALYTGYQIRIPSPLQRYVFEIKKK